MATSDISSPSWSRQLPPKALEHASHRLQSFVADAPDGPSKPPNIVKKVSTALVHSRWVKTGLKKKTFPKLRAIFRFQSQVVLCSVFLPLSSTSICHQLIRSVAVKPITSQQLQINSPFLGKRSDTNGESSNSISRCTSIAQRLNDFECLSPAPTSTGRARLSCAKGTGKTKKTRTMTSPQIVFSEVITIHLLTKRNKTNHQASTASS